MDVLFITHSNAGQTVMNSAESPTKEVLEDIVRHNPTFTVEELFTNVRDMKRMDVIEAISPYFVGKRR